MAPIVEIAVDAAAVARNRRRDTGMRTNMESLQFKKGGEDGGEFSQLHDSGSPARALTVDNGQAPLARVQGPSRTPLGKPFFSVSI
jgi:hypothetical protein